MSEAIQPVYEGGFEMMSQKPELTLVKETVEHETNHEWNEHEFSFRPSRFVSDTFEVTEGMRVRGVLEAINTECGNEIELPANDKPVLRVNKRLNQMVTINGESLRRRDLLAEKEVVGTMLKELDAANHPISQALKQLREDFTEDQLTDIDYQQTVINTIKATHEEEFRTIYDAHLKSLRSQ